MTQARNASTAALRPRGVLLGWVVDTLGCFLVQPLNCLLIFSPQFRRQGSSTLNNSLPPQGRLYALNLPTYENDLNLLYL